MRYVQVGVVLLAGGCATANAFQVERAEARYIDREYQFEMTALLEAPLADVERILRDYENYPTLDSRILEARVVERPSPHIAMLATTLRACFGPVCRTVRRVEQVEEAPGRLVAISDVARSDVQLGETRTQLADDAGRTRVTYLTRLRPKFWIPAFVARRLMLETLEDATIELFRSVEKQARDGRRSMEN
jgi:hypothetical protein